MNGPQPRGETLSLLHRVALAFSTFFSILFQRDFASRVARIRSEIEHPPGEVPAPAHAEKGERAAVQLLMLLQREGRLVDFVEEELDGFSDAQIGAAARIVHDGCKRVFAEHFTLEPVYPKNEGAPITIEPGFDPSVIRLSGNVVGSPPFSGSLRHHGWKVSQIRFPPIPDNKGAAIVAPAEVEL